MLVLFVIVIDRLTIKQEILSFCHCRHVSFHRSEISVSLNIVYLKIILSSFQARKKLEQLQEQYRAIDPTMTPLSNGDTQVRGSIWINGKINIL